MKWYHKIILMAVLTFMYTVMKHFVGFETMVLVGIVNIIIGQIPDKKE